MAERLSPWRSAVRAFLCFGIPGGFLGPLAVWYGQEHRISDFHDRSGYWGTHFLDSYLYCMGSTARTVVALIWFFYCLVAFGVLGALISFSFGGARRETVGSPPESE